MSVFLRGVILANSCVQTFKRHSSVFFMERKTSPKRWLFCVGKRSLFSKNKHPELNWGVRLGAWGVLSGGTVLPAWLQSVFTSWFLRILQIFWQDTRGFLVSIVRIEIDFRVLLEFLRPIKKNARWVRNQNKGAYQRQSCSLDKTLLWFWHLRRWRWQWQLRVASPFAYMAGRAWCVGCFTKG